VVDFMGQICIYSSQTDNVRENSELISQAGTQREQKTINRLPILISLMR
jgi:hypothetical protein